VSGFTADIPEDLLHAVYEAAMDASKWDLFLEQWARSVPGTRCLLVRHDPSAHAGQIITSKETWEPVFVDAYNRHFGRVNPWLKNVSARPTGIVFPSELMCTVEELRRSEFYSDWVLPQKISSGAGVTIIQDSGRVMAISALFGNHSDEQKRLAAECMQRLVPHLQRAGAINRQLAGSAFRWQAAEEALNRLLVGVVIVADDLSAIFMNRSAEALLAKSDGIALTRSGKLAFADTDAARLLAELVRFPRKVSPGILSVPRPSREKPFALLVAPVTTAAPSVSVPLAEFRQARAILFIKDTGAVAAVPSETISDMFDLSRAEARLVKLLLDGHRLEDAAHLLGVSHNTVKTQLRSAFDKLGCSRQSDLVRLISSSLPHFVKQAD
jgi:DNA-binding CsgD family transcriptional regulator